MGVDFHWRGGDKAGKRREGFCFQGVRRGFDGRRGDVLYGTTPTTGDSAFLGLANVQRALCLKVAIRPIGANRYA